MSLLLFAVWINTYPIDLIFLFFFGLDVKVVGHVMLGSSQKSVFCRSSQTLVLFDII